MNHIQNILRIANFHQIKTMMFSTKAELPSSVLIFVDKQTIVGWHPEPYFPYEYSLPISEEKAAETNLLFKSNHTHNTFYKKKPIIIVEELAKMTFTTKHRWFPRKRDIRAKKTLPNRPYL